MATPYDKIGAGLAEAAAFASGEKPAARIHMHGHEYVPAAELAALIHDLESANRSVLAETEARAAAEAERDEWRERAESSYGKGSDGEIYAAGSRCAALKAENDRLREALKPFVDFIDAFDAKPLRSLDDKFYGIHSGTRWQAELRFSDFRRARAALNGEGA